MMREKVIRVAELTPIRGQKSFYGKAQVLFTGTGNIYLQSYKTVVCGIVDGQFQKYWDDWSATTGKHIDSFVRHNHFSNGMNKKTWDSLQYVSECPVSMIERK